MKHSIKYLVAGITLLFFYIIIDTGEGIELELPKNYSDSAILINYDQVLKEATPLLQKLLQIKSIRGNEIEVALFIQKLLEKEGIQSKIYASKKDPTRANLVAVLNPKKDMHANEGIIISSHFDVVEAQASEWENNPFSGKVANGYVHGRGAVDMKGMAILELMAMILIKRKNIPINRKIMFLGLADEESGATFGAKFMIKNHKDLFNGYKYMINEGGVGTEDVGIKGSKLFNLQYADKGVLWIEATATGKSGHGSTPLKKYASLNLTNFLQEVVALDTSITYTGETEKFFYQMGEASAFPNSFFLKRSGNPLVKLLLSGTINKAKYLRAITRNTISITGLHTNEGKGMNVVVGKSVAKLDIRTLPGNADDYYAKVKNLAKKYDIQLKIKETVISSASTLDSKLFKQFGAIAKKNVPGVVITPLLSPGFTDSNFFRKHMKMECYGLIPMIMKQNEIDGMHGKDEKVSLENIKRGIKIIFETLRSVATNK